MADVHQMHKASLPFQGETPKLHIVKDKIWVYVKIGILEGLNLSPSGCHLVASWGLDDFGGLVGADTDMILVC